MSGAETARRRVFQRRIGGAEALPPNSHTSLLYATYLFHNIIEDLVQIIIEISADINSIIYIINSMDNYFWMTESIMEYAREICIVMLLWIS